MSVQTKLGRIRPEIIHIKYEVDTDGALEKRELAFLMGIMSDLSGDRHEALPDLGDERRSFLNINRDNIGDIQRKINPHLDLLVKNELAGDGTNLAISLDFPTLESFSPVGVIKQDPTLRELLEIRQKLASLASRIDGKQEVTSRLEELLRRTDELAAGATSEQQSHSTERGVHA
jgi:type VI secretion system protein ImpB